MPKKILQGFLVAFLLLVSANDIHAQQDFKIKMCTTDNCAKVRKITVDILRYLASHINKTYRGHINVVAPTNDLPSGSPASFWIREKKNKNYIFVTLSFFWRDSLTEADVALILSHELCHFIADPKDRSDEFAMDRCAFQLIKKSGYAPSGTIVSILEREKKILHRAMLDVMGDLEMEKGTMDPIERYRSRRHFRLPDNTRHIRKRIWENKERREFFKEKLPKLEGGDFILFSKNEFRFLREQLPNEVK